MNDAVTWVGVAASVIAVVIAWMTYRRQSNRKALEYLVLSSQRLVNRRVSSELVVTFDGRVVSDPALSVLRLVSVGDSGIPASSFETSLTITFEGAREVVTASVAAVRPKDLPVLLKLETNRVSIEPLLLNAGDLIEVQALTDGYPREISVNARIADVRLQRRLALPYPPGSGPEGEMNAVDKFMWFVMPAVVAALLYVSIGSSDLSLAAKIAWSGLVSVLFGVLYPLRLHNLVHRRRSWRPEFD